MKFEIGPDARKRYVDRRKQDIVSLRNAQKSRDYETIRGLAHQLKGNGVTFGFPEVTDHARVMETAAIASDTKGVDKEIDWFDAWLKSLP